ncbi:MgtC/SapB family protein [Puia dinghuensis]|uniref:Protein MgtC n=1 Tax=Puia dinghuensis TaxID=1792502 RepID=A0A8J2XWM1_9BACT|nr:MgtC/SapB family protein [Puia dinghuensis]GGB20972.1 magnesium transporter [Puia dinghuensis]
MLTIFHFTTRLFLALFLGAAIGVERQWRQRMAGLRTNTLVSLGAAIFVTLAVMIGGDATGRVVSYVVSGVGFLGAGVIMKDGMNVRGLNTAATLWCSAAIGSLAGMGYVAEAAIGTAFILGAHLVLRPIGDKISALPIDKAAQTQLCYVFTIRMKEEIENQVRVLLVQYMNEDDQLLLRSLKSSDNHDPAIALVNAEIFANGNQDHKIERLAGRLTITQGISEVSWKVVGEENDL